MKTLIILGIIAFIALFIILIYQLSKTEHDAQKWRKMYFDKVDEAAETFAQNIKLKAQANDLCDKLNDCQLKNIILMQHPNQGEDNN